MAKQPGCTCKPCRCKPCRCGKKSKSSGGKGGKKK